MTVSNITEVDRGNDADLSNWRGVESVTLKVKGTEHKHCTLVDEVVSHVSTQFWYWYSVYWNWKIKHMDAKWWELDFSLVEWKL